jgi:tRNA A-37 threonylcarbamoyl transferase component Bud32
MQFDLNDPAAVDAAVREAVKAELESSVSSDDASDASRTTIETVERKALLGFLMPYVDRELKRVLLAKVKKAVRILDSNASESPRNKAKLAASCVGLVLGGRKTASDKLERIGFGGYGQVFAVDAKRVVKMVDIDNKNDLDDFNAEVEMMKRASKANVSPAVIEAVPCFSDGVGVLAGIIVIDRIPGRNLRDWIDVDKPSAAKREAVRDKLEAAIVALHKLSVYHHDLHAGNVMVTPKGEPFIVDFGHATSTPERNNRFLNRMNKDRKRHEDFDVLDAFDDDDDAAYARRRMRWAGDAKKMAFRVLGRLCGDVAPAPPPRGLPPPGPPQRKRK